MLKITIFLVFLVTAMTRLIAFYTGIPAAAYLILIPLFVISTVMPNRVEAKFKFMRVDLWVFALLILTLLWAPVSAAMASMGNNFPWNQFRQQILWGTLNFAAYFSVRYASFRQASWPFWALCIVFGASVPLIYLQQFRIIDQFYDEEVARLVVATFEDQMGEIRHRNAGFFGNWHDAGAAMDLLLFAAIACLYWPNTQGGRSKPLIAATVVLGALFLTSSRASFILGLWTLTFFWLFVEPVMSRNIRKLIGGAISTTIFSVFLLALTIVIISYYPNFFKDTIWYAESLDLLQGQGRDDAQIESLKYLMSDQLRALLGWGLGIGGIAAVKGLQITPVNLVDNQFVWTLAHFGVIGALVYISLYCLLLKEASKIYKNVVRRYRQGACDRGLVLLAQFCVLGIWCGLFGFFLAAHLDNRVFVNPLLLCVATLVRHYYDSPGRSAIGAGEKVMHVSAPRAA